MILKCLKMIIIGLVFLSFVGCTQMKSASLETVNDSSLAPSPSPTPNPNPPPSRFDAPLTILEGNSLVLEGGLRLSMQSDGNLVLYSHLSTALWSSWTFQRCQGGCRAVLESTGNLELYNGSTSYWSSNTFGTGYQLWISSNEPYIGLISGESLIWAPLLGPYYKPKFDPLGSSRVQAYALPVSQNQGVISGWAFDSHSPSESIRISFYADGPAGQGTFMGSTLADVPDYSTRWVYGIQGSHGFNFSIPNSWRDSKSHQIFAHPTDLSGQIAPPVGGGTLNGGFAFNLPPLVQANSVALGNTCLSPESKCASRASDFGVPNFPTAPGWSDGVNYFDRWKCSSKNGINYIARLNILPLGTHGPNFMKDSLYWNGVDADERGTPIIYFTSGRLDGHFVYSLKKTLYDSGEGTWKIYDVLDFPQSQLGISSNDGHGPDFIMNDYSMPGWGPTATLPGYRSKIPGVANISASSSFESYPLLGTGPLGLETMANYLQADDVTFSGSVGGRTCIHMNPKLFDYDSDGRPFAMIAHLFRGVVDQPCLLPPSALISQLPSAGYYVYRYRGAVGWQLDLDTGLVEDFSIYKAPLKLLNGSQRQFISGTWQGQVQILNLDSPAPRSRETILDCSSSGVHFGEPTGSASQIMFLANDPEKGDQPVGLNVFMTDIYYAFGVP